MTDKKAMKGKLKRKHRGDWEEKITKRRNIRKHKGYRSKERVVET